MKSCMVNASSALKQGLGFGWVFTGIASHFGNDGVGQVSTAVTNALAAGVNWLAIIQVIVPLILDLFKGGSITLQQIIDAINALFNQPATGNVNVP